MMNYFFEAILVAYFVAALANSTSNSAKNSNGPKKTAQCNFLSSELKQMLAEIKQEIRNGLCSEVRQQLVDLKHAIGGKKKVYRNCAEVYQSGFMISGVYKIDPDGLGEFQVFCDLKTAGGGWTVFQKRQDGSVDFYRPWDEYKRGFGNLNGEFWLGLDKIHRLTASGSNKLRVDMEDVNGKIVYAEYSSFAVANERAKYMLSFGSYSGTATDSLAHHRGSPFTTRDRDNDNSGDNCAVTWKGAFWYNQCYMANLNGPFLPAKNANKWQRIVWNKGCCSSYFLKRSEMKMRPKDF